MGFAFKTAEFKTLRTPSEVVALAMKLRGLGSTEVERDDKASRMRTIKGKILGGEMLPFRWCVASVLAGGPAKRVNGMHSSESFLLLTPEEWAQVRFPVVVSWEEYDCDTPADLPHLFAQFDPAWSARSREDRGRPHLGQHKALFDSLNIAEALPILAGVRWYRVQVEGLKLKAEDSEMAFVHEGKDAEEFLLWCASFLQKQKTREMLSKPVVAALYHVRHAGEGSRTFWKRVASGKAPNDADTIEYKLAEFLDQAADQAAEWHPSVRRHFRGNKLRPSDKDVFATCLRAFSAFVTGTKVGDVFTPAKDQPAAKIAETFKVAA